MSAPQLLPPAQAYSHLARCQAQHLPHIIIIAAQATAAAFFLFIIFFIFQTSLMKFFCTLSITHFYQFVNTQSRIIFVHILFFMFTYNSVAKTSLLAAERMYKKTKTAEKIYGLLWLGWKDSNLRNDGVRVRCLTTLATPQCLFDLACFWLG